MEINRKESLRVSIPTTPKRINFLTGLIDSLNRQTLPDFEIALIVPKGSRNLYSDIESGIPVTIIEQEGKGFLDAMQVTVGSSAGYDININLDDDSIIAVDHVERYVKCFSTYRRTGMIFGTEEGQIPGVHGNLARFLRFNHFVNRKPLIDALAPYSVYFNSTGVLSGRTNYGIGTATLMGMGANMAWISEALEGARLPTYNEKSLGILNEQYLALQSVARGFEVRVEQIDAAPRIETRGDSLSSDTSIKGYNRRLLELYSSPIFVNSIAAVDTSELKRSISRMKMIPLTGEIRMGSRILECALNSIESGLKEYDAFKEIEKLWTHQAVEAKG